jgi:hypothetical protein
MAHKARSRRERERERIQLIWLFALLMTASFGIRAQASTEEKILLSIIYRQNTPCNTAASRPGNLFFMKPDSLTEAAQAAALHVKGNSNYCTGYSSLDAFAEAFCRQSHQNCNNRHPPFGIEQAAGNDSDENGNSKTISSAKVILLNLPPQ